MSASTRSTAVNVAFFEAGGVPIRHGELYVALGSDKTLTDLKGRPPVNSGHKLPLHGAVDQFVSRRLSKLVGHSGIEVSSLRHKPA